MMAKCPNQIEDGPMHVIWIGNLFRQEEDFKCYTCGLRFNLPHTENRIQAGNCNGL
jgi:hypothetical protein